MGNARVEDFQNTFTWSAWFRFRRCRSAHPMYCRP